MSIGFFPINHKNQKNSMKAFNASAFYSFHTVISYAPYSFARISPCDTVPDTVYSARQHLQINCPGLSNTRSMATIAAPVRMGSP